MTFHSRPPNSEREEQPLLLYPSTMLFDQTGKPLKKAKKIKGLIISPTREFGIANSMRVFIDYGKQSTHPP